MGRSVLYYVDPMHPAYRSDKPGIAPDCGMPLEAVYAGDAPVASTQAQLPAGAVGIDGATQRMLGIRLASVEKNSATHVIRVVGRVTPEDSRVYRVNSGDDGYIRETHSDSVGMPVKKDQQLATAYEPNVLNIASGFLATAAQVPGTGGGDGARTVPWPGALNKQGVGSLQTYIERLHNYGMGDAQIKRMFDSHQLPQSVDIVSPTDGFVLSRNLSAGLIVERGTEFYRIADLSKVWVVAEVYEQEAPYARPGGQARVALRGDARQFPAAIADSLPQSEAGGGTVKLRLEVDNPTFVLRPEMLVDVELPVRLPAAVTAPLDALIDSGAHSRVYVERSEGVFEPREVETGWRFGERVQILRGLQPGERVVAAATFLVDSESRLKTPDSLRPPAAAAPEHMAAAKTATDPSCGMTVDPAKATASGNSVAHGGVTYYFCSKECKQKFENTMAGSAGMRQGGADD
jgi:Cu(I)/Ag(I) efflux system membrane fusion protein